MRHGFQGNALCYVQKTLYVSFSRFADHINCAAHSMTGLSYVKQFPHGFDVCEYIDKWQTIEKWRISDLNLTLVSIPFIGYVSRCWYSIKYVYSFPVQ